MAEKTEQLKFVIRAEDATAEVRERFVRQTVDAMKRVNREAARSTGAAGGGAAIKDALGAESSVGQAVAMLRGGGYVAGAVLAVQELAKLGTKFTDLTSAVNNGTKSWSDFATEFIRAIPIVGAVGDNLAKLAAGAAGAAMGSDVVAGGARATNALSTTQRDRLKSINTARAEDQARYNAAVRRLRGEMVAATADPATRAELEIEERFRDETKRINDDYTKKLQDARNARVEAIKAADKLQDAAASTTQRRLAENIFRTESGNLGQNRQRDLALAESRRQFEYRRDVQAQAKAARQAEEEASRAALELRKADVEASERAVFEARVRVLRANGDEYKAELEQLARDEAEAYKAINDTMAQRLAAGALGTDEFFRPFRQRAEAIRQAAEAERRAAESREQDRQIAQRLAVRDAARERLNRGELFGIPIADIFGRIADQLGNGNDIPGAAQLSGTSAIDGRGLTGIGFNLQASAALSQANLERDQREQQRRMADDVKKTREAIVGINEAFKAFAKRVGTAS